MADRGGRRPAADPAVHLLEPARVHRGTHSRGRSTAAATTRTRSSSKAFRSAATCRAAATTRCRRRPRWSRSSSCRPARSAPSSAAARRRSPTSSSSPARTTSTGRARSTCMDSSMDAKPFVAKALGQNLPEREQQNWAVAVGGPIVLPGMYNGRNRSFFFATFEKTHAEDRRRRRSARCRPASSRTATSRVCSIPPTRVMPARERSSAPTRSDGRCASARFTTRARRASSTAAWSGIRSPTTRSRARCGMPWRGTPSIRACGMRRSSIACSTTSRCWRPAARCSTRRRSRRSTTRCSNDRHRASFYVNREWRERNNSAAGRYGAAARVADQPVSAAEHAELDDQGLRKLGDQRSTPAPLRLRLQPLRQRESQRVFQCRLAVEDRADQSAGYDLPAVRVRRGVRFSEIWATTDRSTATRPSRAARSSRTI